MRVRFLLFVLFAVLIAGACFQVAWHPIAPLPSSATPPPRGVYHIHTTASHDGYTEPNLLKKTAADLGLSFLVVTDHNRQTRIPSDNHVTVLNFPELSTPFGHVVSFGLHTPLPDSLRKGWLVLDEIVARGGKPFLAHPTRWRNPWQGQWQPVGGVEIHNIASQLQNTPLLGLALLPTSMLNPNLGKSLLFARNHKAMSRWDDFSSPEVVGLCASDSHGRISVKHELSMWTMELTVPWPDEPEERLRTAVSAISRGQFQCTAWLLAHGGGFQFAAELFSGESMGPGSSVSQNATQSLNIVAPKVKAKGLSLVLFRNGVALARSSNPEFRYPSPLAGTYRVEVHLAVPGLFYHEKNVPVLYSNKIQITK